MRVLPASMRALPARHPETWAVCGLCRLCFLVFCLLILQVVGSVSLFHAAANIVLIANPDLPVEQLSRYEVKNIFLSKIKTVQGVCVRPVMLKKKEITSQFLREEISKTPLQFSNYYRMMIFTGRGRPPHVASSEEELISYVLSTPCAIGYIDAATAPASVKILQVTE